MQQTGTLRKRGRTNLAKVKGRPEVIYDANLDSFTGRELYRMTDETTMPTKAFTVFTGEDTRLQFSAASMRGHRQDAHQSSLKCRVTRDPHFHQYNESCTESKQTCNVQIDAISVTATPLQNERQLPENLQNRRHLLDAFAMRRLKQIILLGATSGAFPWKWNGKLSRIDKWSPTMEKLWRIQWTFFTTLSCFLCLFQVYTFYNRLSEETESYRGVFQSYFSLHIYVYDLLFQANLYYYKDAMRHYINTMLAFNQNYVQRYLVHLNGHKMNGRLAVNVGTITKAVQVFATINVFLQMPYQKWFLFSYIYPKPWYWLIPGAIQEYTVIGQHMAAYILILWTVVGHANTLQFWIREIHKDNDSDYTTDELRLPKNSVETYKALLVLNQVFNDCMAPMSTPLLLMSSFSALVPCGYIIIRSMNHYIVDEFPEILTYPVGLWDCVSSCFAVIAMAATVTGLCCSYIDSWSKTKHKDFRRILLSCPTIKVWVGRFYFLTVSTTMTFFMTVFDVITDFLISCP